jgi:hypothetical protein
MDKRDKQISHFYGLFCLPDDKLKLPTSDMNTLSSLSWRCYDPLHVRDPRKARAGLKDAQTKKFKHLFCTQCIFLLHQLFKYIVQILNWNLNFIKIGKMGFLRKKSCKIIV